MVGKRRTPSSKLQAAFAGSEATLLDLVDSLIDKGAMVNADLTLGLANVDLVYLRLSSLLAAADRILNESAPEPDRTAGRTPRRTRATKRKARRSRQ
ncbi:MAG: gas vesicle protein [Acidobacteria bacterium]|nr:gas vesicle protein [Acidobacteriota bacterium]